MWDKMGVKQKTMTSPVSNVIWYITKHVHNYYANNLKDVVMNEKSGTTSMG